MLEKVYVSNFVVSDASKDRGNNINLIRFIAAAMVIYGHMGVFINGPEPQIFSQAVSYIAVKVFFILSGYLICNSYRNDRNLFRYMTRRVFRIFPGLVFVCFVMAFVAGPLLSTLSFDEYFSTSGPLKYFALNSLMHPDYFLPGVFADNPYPNAVNGSLWTLPIEFCMYLVVPLCFLVSTKRTRKGLFVALAIAFSALSIARLAFFPAKIFVVWGTNVFDGLILVPYFFIGAAVSYFDFKPKLSVQASLVLVLCACCITGGLPSAYNELVSLALLPYLTFSLSFPPEGARFGRWFAVNDFSYGLYVWAFPVQQAMVMLLGPTAFPFTGLYATVCLVPSLAMAMVSWFLVEKPASKLGRRLTSWSRRREPQAKAESERASVNPPQKTFAEDQKKDTDIS